MPAWHDRPMRRLLAPAIVLALTTACAPAPVRNPMATWVPSKNFDQRGAVLIVLHATEQGSVQKSLDTLRGDNGRGPVSAHYLIGRDGHIYQLVAESARAWHAGGGSWGTITDLNDASIGIELDNDGHADYTDVQFDALVRLLADVCARRHIPRSQVIGHADLAPTRKTDPGAQFPWQRLHAAGFGRWPEDAPADPPPGFDPWIAMAAIGYPLKDRVAAVRAFHRHFRGRDDGDSPDAAFDDDDLRILYALARPKN